MMNLKIKEYTVTNTVLSYNDEVIGKFNYELLGQFNEFKLVKININIEENFLDKHFVNFLSIVTNYLIKSDNTLKIVYDVIKEDKKTINYLKEAKYIFSKDINLKYDEYKITKQMI